MLRQQLVTAVTQLLRSPGFLRQPVVHPQPAGGSCRVWSASRGQLPLSAQPHPDPGPQQLNNTCLPILVRMLGAITQV